MARDEAYRRAEQMLEEARRSGAKELDLSVPWGGDKTPKLTELPESLGQLTQLQSLEILAATLLKCCSTGSGSLTRHVSIAVEEGSRKKSAAL